MVYSVIMLPKDFNSKLAIYVAERLETDRYSDEGDWHHSFLMLVDETTRPITVLQQLHFDADSRNSCALLPIVMEGTSDPQKFGDRFNNILVYPVIGGKIRDVLNLWNDALAYSLDLKSKNITFDREYYKFGEEAVNCRAGVIAALDSIGIDYSRGFYAGGAGTQCCDIPLNRDFSEVNRSNAESIFGRNSRLIRSLGANLYKDRYIGPVTGTMHVISP